MCFHSRINRLLPVTIEISATVGAVSSIGRNQVSNGIAIKASPNPKVAFTVPAKKTMLLMARICSIPDKERSRGLGKGSRWEFLRTAFETGLQAWRI